MKIGFFDSGLGGLMILKAVRQLLPEYDYVYFGDTANLPYGDKSEEEVYAFTERGVETLFSQGAVLVVVACNTASAESLRRLQDGFLKEKYPENKVLGVIVPTLETLAEMHAHTAFVIGTQRTIDSKKYERELSKIAPTISLLPCATPELVPLIEAGQIDAAFTKLSALIDVYIPAIDSVVLACTHYVLLKQQLRESYPDLDIISQDEIIPKKIQTYLQRHSEITEKLTRGHSVEIHLSAETAYFENVKNAFLEKRGE